MDITNIDLESGVNRPYFKSPYRYGGHNEIDVIAGNRLLPCLEIYAGNPKQQTQNFAIGLLGDWLSFYDPDIVIPPQRLMNTIKFKLANVGGTIGGDLAIHTLNTLMAQQQIQNAFKGSVVADLGSGSGLQAITALKLGASHAILVDLDPGAMMQVKKLMTLNGFGQDRYTTIHASLAEISQFKHHLSKVDIVIANIGSYSEYGNADIQATQIIKYAPKLQYYIAGGYRWMLHDYVVERNWIMPSNKKAEGQDQIVNTLERGGLKIVNQVNSHKRGRMLCSRTFIAKKEGSKLRRLFKGDNFTFLKNTQ